MAEYRIDSMGSLASQMRFTPIEARREQVWASEELLLTLDPLKAYPLDFIIYRITGYRPKTGGDEFLPGAALQHDLGLLIENVGETLNSPAVVSGDPTLAIDEVAARFGVASKTIQRWRRRGLPARRYIFADGRRRVGFRLSCVERYFWAQRQQATHDASFSQVEQNKASQILRHARQLLASGLSAEEIAARVARRVDRSSAAVLRALRDHDRQHPGPALLNDLPEELTSTVRLGLLRAFRRGVPLATLAQRVARPRVAVYSIILAERMAALSRRKARFIDDPLYDGPDAAAAIRQILDQPAPITPRPSAEEQRIPRDLPPYLQALWRTPLLGASQERALFLAFNFYKREFVAARSDVDPQRASRRQIDALEAQLRVVTAVKNQIVQANLRLVVSVARKHLRPGLSLMELISEGNLVLMRAVETYDFHRGNRFSTYATFALMKGFARSAPQLLASRAHGTAPGVFLELPDRRPHQVSQQALDREHVGSLLERLDSREQSVLRGYYGLGEKQLPATYEEIGNRLGLSKERVRQIERAALAKLRAASGRIHG